MIKKILSLALVFSLSLSAAEQAITQWVYNTLERAQANLDKGNLEAVSYTHLTLPTTVDV